jgi:hypothetical protein
MSDEHRCKYVIEWRKGSPEERCGQVVHGDGWRCPEHGGSPAPEPEVSEEAWNETIEELRSLLSQEDWTIADLDLLASHVGALHNHIEALEAEREEYLPAEIGSYDWRLYVGTGPYETEIPPDTPIYVKRSEVEAKQREGGRDA